MLSHALSHTLFLLTLQMETLSSGIPLLVARLGNRRRLERSWMGWRGWMVEQRLKAVETQLEEHGRFREELEYMHMLWEEAQLKEQIKEQQGTGHQALPPSADPDGQDTMAAEGPGGEFPLSRRTTAK